ncbi:MAG: glycosyltransferase, partial [Parcubacteria group bacterium]
MGKNKGSFSVCFVSSYHPRECGIATFTQSIIDYIDMPKEKIKIVSISDKPGFYKYGSEVIHEAFTEDKSSFVSAAEKINKDPDIKVVSIQHVFSLFGGKYGENILSFMRRIKKPIVTTFHMVYSKNSSPNKFEVVDSSYSEITDKIIKMSDKIVVIIQPMADILIDQYGVDKEKIIIIPHGNPAVKRQLPGKYKKLLGIGKGKMISSFGLIRPKKGLEHVIYAMPEVVKKYPDARLFILGESHPNRSADYYNFLVEESKKINLLNKNIFFVNRFLSFREIINYIFATDVFITPYLVPEQTSSGAI